MNTFLLQIGVAFAVLAVLFTIVKSNEPPFAATNVADVSRLWGTYRPAVYFGAKTRTRHQLLSGFMWFTSHLDAEDAIFKIRHLCEDRDHLKRYGWLEHDGHRYGTQQIIDEKTNANITTTWLKRDESSAGGGDWIMRFHAEPLSEKADFNTLTTLFYFGTEHPKSPPLELKNKKSSTGYALKEPLQVESSSPDLGTFTLSVTQDDESRPPPKPSTEHKRKVKSLRNLQKAHAWLLRVPAGRQYDIQSLVEKEYIAQQRKIQDELLRLHRAKVEKARKAAVKAGREVPIDHGPDPTEWPLIVPTVPNTVAKDDANILVTQRTLQMPFTIDVTFVSHARLGCGSASAAGNFAGGAPCAEKQIADERKRRISESKTAIASESAAFRARFASTFGLCVDEDETCAEPVTKLKLATAKAAFSNLIGSHGYWFGHSLLYQGESSEIDPSTGQPKQNIGQGNDIGLYSGVPSRSFFPRGFLWDEGFHQLLACEWDSSVTYDVIGHWLNAMRPSGWIPREQILGAEALSRVPAPFRVQYPTHANPPTLLLAVEKIMRRYVSDSNSLDQQEGSAQPDASSTADMASSSDASTELGRLASFLSTAWPRLEVNYEWYRTTQAGAVTFSFRWRGRTENHTLSSGLDDYPRSQMPSDDELHLDGLCWMVLYSRLMARIARFLNKPSEVVERYASHSAQFAANVDDLHWSREMNIYTDATVTGEFQPHVGYVNIFPLLLGVIPAHSERLGHLLDVLLDAKQLYTNYGIRSLSKRDPLFGTSENYWRGPIWMNINYLLISSLHRNYLVEGPNEAKAKELYRKLTLGILSNVANEYERTGYLWEQYDDRGRGKRSHPFTGWTALYALILSKKF